MQSFEELKSITGLPDGNVRTIYNSCVRQIGKIYGCNKVADINYTENNEKDVTLECTLCGKISHKMFLCGRNKWNEISHSCDCMRIQKIPKNKKGDIIRNDDPSYIGMIYGDYQVIQHEYVPHKNKAGGTIYWVCRCVHCKKVVKDLPSRIRAERKCKCTVTKSNQELWDSKIGEKYGMLTIIGFTKRMVGKYKANYAICKCDCGNEYCAQYSALQNGQTKSCGCMKDKYPSRSDSPLYGTWNGMRYRCNNIKAAAYADYGGRGIRVCDEWNDPETGFDAFEKWAWDNGYVPDSGLSLDRIDVNGNYEPNNCRYVNYYIQAANKRKNPKPRDKKLYAIDGIELTKEEWCQWFSISVPAVNYRMKKLGWNFEKAVTTPKIHPGTRFVGDQDAKRVAALNRCRSAIEANMLFAFFRLSGDMFVEPQVKIGKYRADFLVRNTNIIVECDGFDNHKTKEQIQHDCQRDRFLSKSGYIVLRFTGAEISKDADACAKEVEQIVKTLYPELGKNGKNNVG